MNWQPVFNIFLPWPDPYLVVVGGNELAPDPPAVMRGYVGLGSSPTLGTLLVDPLSGGRANKFFRYVLVITFAGCQNPREYSAVYTVRRFLSIPQSTVFLFNLLKIKDVMENLWNQRFSPIFTLFNCANLIKTRTGGIASWTLGRINWSLAYVNWASFQNHICPFLLYSIFTRRYGKVNLHAHMSLNYADILFIVCTTVNILFSNKPNW